MSKARAWRKTGKTAKRTSGPRSQSSALSESAMPTQERLAKAGGDFQIGGDGAHRIVRMLDAPLEQARARGQLTETQFHVLAKYRLHWFLGYQSGSLRAVDLDRVMVSGQQGGGGDQVIWHRDMFETAGRGLLALERMALASVVLSEHNITTVGSFLGYNSPYRGRQAVLDSLRSASVKITSAWLAMEHA